MTQVFPTWRYHKSEEPRLIKSEEQLKALGPGWADTPAAFEKSEAEKPRAEEPQVKDEKKPSKKKAE